ncbi:MAG: hypothetical protein HY367_00635 [Candidatus Aenigmarchaeota archaeon]|nr:hypothetical protein [Candidatus Aenigmarchaeota archaeon]
MIIGLVGRRASGKDTVAQYLEKKYGYRHYDYTRDVLSPILSKQGKPVTRENLVRLAMSLRGKMGNAAPTMLLCRKISGKGDYVVSGIRFPEEVEYLRGRYGSGFTLVEVRSSHTARHERAVSRNIKGEGKLTYKAFMEKEGLPTEKILNETVKMADRTVYNSGNVKDLHGKTDLLIRRLNR